MPATDTTNRDDTDDLCDELYDTPAEDCWQCGGPACELGKLGSVTHYRCRCCGWEWSDD